MTGFVRYLTKISGCIAISGDPIVPISGVDNRLECNISAPFHDEKNIREFISNALLMVLAVDHIVSKRNVKQITWELRETTFELQMFNILNEEFVQNNTQNEKVQKLC